MRPTLAARRRLPPTRVRLVPAEPPDEPPAESTAGIIVTVGAAGAEPPLDPDRTAPEAR